MSIKSWVLGRVHQIGGLAGRADLPSSDAGAEPAPRSPARTGDREVVSLPGIEHLGAYGSLIAAVRDELEHFVASHVRLHLAIADRDRFLLTGIAVRCQDDGARQRLAGFLREFKPEQVKRYLAREVIGALPNAAAMDLSQFSGLEDADTRDAAAEKGEYDDLLEALRVAPPPATKPYLVEIVGRWTEQDAASRLNAPAGPLGNTPSTPMAGQRVEFDLEDGEGRRQVVLPSVVAGRRYLVGTGEGCDIRVHGNYASRRHAELWLERGRWWIGDAGSTNGVRVEPPPAAARGSGARPDSAVPGPHQPVALPDGARIVLSARADGPASDYPWLALRVQPRPSAPGTPVAPGLAANAPRTPLTAISPPLDGTAAGWELRARLGAGEQTMSLSPARLPLSVGRSRNQALVVDRGHDAVSGHHLDITAIDEAGAEVRVHGDNGVWLDGVHHGAGSRLRWRQGQVMVLGASLDEGPACTLVLARAGQG
ncbi:FHA domain-containing protein [Ideonella sp. YS5]|uniref:FHA domain-containing protein n=1 Tax=Ideonella sp. YS5 TaxID=3453714 RepID=UPI003EEAE5AD